MSNLGDRLDDVINQFRAIRDHGQWREVHEEAHLPAVKSALNDAASEEALDSLASTVSGLPTEDTTLSPSGVVEALRSQSVLNSDGSVGADVDNEITTSDVADVGSLSVGEGDEITNIPIQDGDLDIIDSDSYISADESTTSTTYTNAFTSVTEMPLLADVVASNQDYSNYYLRFASVLNIDTSSETVYHRLQYHPDKPEAEISHTGTGYPVVTSGLIPYTPSANNYSRHPTQIRVTGGSGSVYATKISLLGEV